MVRRQFRKVTSGEESPINQQKSQWRGRFKIIMQHQEIIPKRAHSVELSLFGDTLWHGVQTMPLCELSGQSLQTSTVRTIYLVRQCKTLWALEKFFWLWFPTWENLLVLYQSQCPKRWGIHFSLFFYDPPLWNLFFTNSNSFGVVSHSKGFGQNCFRTMVLWGRSVWAAKRFCGRFHQGFTKVPVVSLALWGRSVFGCENKVPSLKVLWKFHQGSTKVAQVSWSLWSSGAI